MPAGVTPLLSGAWRRALDLVFPPRCVGCSAFGGFLCSDCLRKAPRAEPPRCPVCWMPVLAARPGSRVEGPGGDVCDRCRRRPFAFEAARAPFVYGGPARDAVHALKYEGVSAVAAVMAELMFSCLEGWALPETVLVPVPLAGRRKRSRGYNQSELLAKEISRLSGLPLRKGLLVRRKASPPQALSADEGSRRANVAGAFAVRAGSDRLGQVLMVDDVMTSGATLDACAQALRAAGQGSIYALTFARED